MLLEVQHVRKEFQNRTHALTDASFSVSQGDFVSVIGPSGAGKTTLFRILNGSLRCDGGAILVNGVHFESADRQDPPGHSDHHRHHLSGFLHWWKCHLPARMC